MSDIAIITDTDSSLPLDISKNYSIVQVPIAIQFGNETFRDAYEANNPLIFERIDKEGRFPTTAAPSPGQFAEAYNAAFAGGAKTVLCFCVSSEVSATYSAARSAVEVLPGKDIRVVDTRNLSMGQGYMVLAAAEAIAAGASAEEGLAIAASVGNRVHLFASLATLKYLTLSGRISHLAASFAGLLDVKPILTVQHGKLQMLERIRTQSKSWARTVEIAAKAGAGCGIERMTILHVNALDKAHEFEKLLRAAMACPTEIMYAEMNPGLSIHSGAGLVGVVFVTKD
jgi:DegV family protein with EDD domain